MHLIFFSLIRFWISTICLAPGNTSGFNVRAPAEVTSNLDPPSTLEAFLTYFLTALE